MSIDVIIGTGSNEYGKTIKYDKNNDGQPEYTKKVYQPINNTKFDAYAYETNTTPQKGYNADINSLKNEDKYVIEEFDFDSNGAIDYSLKYNCNDPNKKEETHYTNNPLDNQPIKEKIPNISVLDKLKRNIQIQLLRTEAKYAEEKDFNEKFGKYLK